ncbi:MAG: hypothetical protein K9K82_14240 [Desulfobacteraceae bacterium]|nr:hypothetical protein [Desulfobacteraceae bacterium]
MKRLTAILVAGLFVLAPLSASAMEMMSDSNMKDVTGQAGVSIIADDVVLENWVGTTSYTDVDGVDGSLSTGGASVTISDQHTVQDIQAIVGYASTDTLYSPGVNLTQSGNEGVDKMAGTDYSLEGEFAAQAITIDVGIAPVATEALQNNADNTNIQLAGVVIGLPTMEMNTSASTKDIGISSTQTGVQNDDATFIRIEESGSTMHVLGGTLEIVPH